MRSKNDYEECSCIIGGGIIVKRRHLPLILCIILTLTLSPILSFGSSGVVDEEVNGQFILSILQGEEWIVAGSLDFKGLWTDRKRSY